MKDIRHPEVATSAFTRVFDALWRPSKGGGPGRASFEARLRSHLRMTVNRSVSL